MSAHETPLNADLTARVIRYDYGGTIEEMLGRISDADILLLKDDDTNALLVGLLRAAEETRDVIMGADARKIIDAVHHAGLYGIPHDFRYQIEQPPRKQVIRLETPVEALTTIMRVTRLMVTAEFLRRNSHVAVIWPANAFVDTQPPPQILMQPTPEGLEYLKQHEPEISGKIEEFLKKEYGADAGGLKHTAEYQKALQAQIDRANRQ